MTAPLRLDSKRWKTLYAHFGNPGDGHPSVPTLLATWHEVAPAYGEEYAYEPLFQAYLHQSTLAEVAYAVVPHLVSRLAELHPDRQYEVLVDLREVELVRRLTPKQIAKELVKAAKRTAIMGPSISEMMVESLRKRLAPLPEDLSPAYLHAMKEVSRIAGRSWRKGPLARTVTSPRFWRRHVAFLREHGWTNDDIAFAMRALRGEVPGVGTYDPFTPGDAWKTLRTIKKKLAPPAWHERTRIGDHELAFDAVHTLAMWRLIDPAKILRS